MFDDYDSGANVAVQENVRVKPRAKRNKVLERAIYGKCRSVPELCVKFGLNYTDNVAIYNLLNLRKSPKYAGRNGSPYEKGEYIGICKRLSAIFKIHVVELFPDNLYESEEFNSTKQDDACNFCLPVDEALSLPSPPPSSDPRIVIEVAEEQELLEQAIARLTDKERLVITSIFLDGRNGGQPTAYHRIADALFLGGSHRCQTTKIEIIRNRAIAKLRILVTAIARERQVKRLMATR